MHELDLSRLSWHKSRRSSGNGACVEVAQLGRSLAVRDSKNPDGGVLLIEPRGWQAFLGTVKKERHAGL